MIREGMLTKTAYNPEHIGWFLEGGPVDQLARMCWENSHPHAGQCDEEHGELQKAKYSCRPAETN